jgi:hypothetical protein
VRSSFAVAFAAISTLVSRSASTYLTARVVTA